MKIGKSTVQIKNKILIGFDNIIADLLSNERPYLIVTDYLARKRKLNISLILFCLTKKY